MKFRSLIIGILLLLAGQAFAHGKNNYNCDVDCRTPWRLGARIIYIAPDPTSGDFPVYGGEINEFTSTIIPEVHLDYFFTENFARTFSL